MHFQNIIEQQQNTKFTAKTPQTADSEPNEQDAFHFKCLSFESQFYRFQDAHNSLSERDQQPIDEKCFKDQSPKTEAQELGYHDIRNQNIWIQDYKYGIKVIEKEDLIKRMIKQVQNIKQNDEGVMMNIFKNQHEYFFVKNGCQVEISLITDGGFERSIFTSKIDYQEASDKDLQAMKDKDSKVEVNFLLEKRKNCIAKPISLKIKQDVIQKILDEKFKLLNKHQILNQIQSITKLKGLLSNLSKQNMGSRIIQKLLGRATEQEIINVFVELKPLLGKLIIDKYGNYIFQKLFSLCKTKQRIQILKSIGQQSVNIIKTKTGTFTYQCIIKDIKTNELQILVENIKDSIISLCLDQYGNHFVKQLLVKHVNYQIYQNIIENFELLANNKYGTVVLKSFLKIGVSYPEYRYLFLTNVVNSFNVIAINQYGHYIVEQYFKYYNYAQLYPLLIHLKNYLVYFSQNQYSSSIIKKFLQNYSDYAGIPLIEQILNNGLNTLMESNSGCFILHRIMDNVKNSQWKKQLLYKMQSITDQLNCYEKRVKWQKFFTTF